MALFDDEERRKPKLLHSIGENLDAASVDEIDRRIVLLRDEIARLEREREKKAGLRGAADAFFKPSSGA